MNEIEYAQRYFGDYTVHGNEIIPKLCPFCNGGESRDIKTFALNFEKHTYNCKRGSCGKTGHFSELLSGVGEKYQEAYPQMIRQKPKRVYKKPETVIAAKTDQAQAYLKARGITQETADAFGIGSDSNGNMTFPYYRAKEDFDSKSATFIKFRKPVKITEGRKMWREEDTEPILFGLHLCDPSRKILYITEGEFDAMVIYQVSCGTVNVVSVPSGSQDFTWIDTCASELSSYKIIAVIGDTDSPGQKMVLEIAAKLDDKSICAADIAAYEGCKDANEALVRRGPECVERIIASVKPLPVEGLINISEIPSVNYTKMERTLSGFKSLDYALGGFMEGDFTVWTGKRGEGKSTVMNQVLLESMNRGTNCCVYTGEMPKERFKASLSICAAGSTCLDKEIDALTGKMMYSVKPSVQRQLDVWMDRRLWLYDNRIVEIDERDSIIQRFKDAYRHYDCRVFLVDSLMTVMTGETSDFYRTQAAFVIRVRNFAEKYGVHVHMIVHPRKGNSVSGNDDVGGMSSNTDIACNTVMIHRCNEKEADELNADAVLSLFKNRAFGDLVDIPLKFDKTSRRFYEPYQPEKIYSWQKPNWEEVNSEFRL